MIFLILLSGLFFKKRDMNIMRHGHLTRKARNPIGISRAELTTSSDNQIPFHQEKINKNNKTTTKFPRLMQVLLMVFIITISEFVFVQALDMSHTPPPTSEGAESKEANSESSKNENNTKKKPINKPNDRCSHKYAHNNPLNQEVELQYCYEHAGRTCCGARDVHPIRLKIS